VIADLPGPTLGDTDGKLIRLDADAAGWGWSLDGRSPGVDLREVLEHELGHALGFSHDDEGKFAVMAEVLRIPATEVPLETVVPQKLERVVSISPFMRPGAPATINAGKPLVIHVGRRIPAPHRLVQRPPAANAKSKHAVRGHTCARPAVG
jgi:hypothetical protein